MSHFHAPLLQILQIEYLFKHTANRHQRSHLNISAPWWMWSRPTFCAAASAKRAVLTALTTAAPHCRAGTKPNALCSTHPGACRAAETGFGAECCIWLHEQLKLGSFLRLPLLQTQPLWSPQLLIAQPFLAGTAAVQPVIVIQMGRYCLVEELPLSGTNLLQALQSTLCLYVSQV